MDGWTDGRMDRWTDGRMDGWTDGRMDGWTDGRMDGWTDGRMDGWTDGRMDGWTDGRMDGWTDGRMDGWTDGGMDGGGAYRARASMFGFCRHALGVPKLDGLGEAACARTEHERLHELSTAAGYDVPLDSKLWVADDVETAKKSSFSGPQERAGQPPEEGHRRVQGSGAPST